VTKSQGQIARGGGAAVKQEQRLPQQLARAGPIDELNQWVDSEREDVLILADVNGWTSLHFYAIGALVAPTSFYLSGMWVGNPRPEEVAYKILARFGSPSSAVIVFRQNDQ
jgi:hypothetical protein